ncbi:MAG TPA: acyl-CoA dehydrogenase family protein [Acidimicrobiales bacterium]|nr:acyl-CoA dehydrogenase family protein [Acidimicrobiales bacterium]
MTASATQIHTLDDALKAVAQVGPVAREHAQKSEDGRQLAPEVVNAITDSGLWGVFAPQTAGGSGLGSFNEVTEIVKALAYEDTSAAWGLFICGGGAAIFASRLSEAGRQEVYHDGCVPVAGVFSPGGSATRTDAGGVTVSGRWPFASGITYARWVLGNAILVGPDGAPQPGMNGLPAIVGIVVPADEVTIVDDWHVAGLRGTGSMSFTLENHVVPADRVIDFFGPPSIEEAKYRVPIMTMVGPYFAAIAIGVAQRAIDEVKALLPTRVGPPTFQPASTEAMNQVALARAMAAVRAAAESTRSIFDRYDARVSAGEDLMALTLADRAEIHHHVVWVAETCQAAVNEMFRLGGASSIYEPNLLQRAWRDINVLNQHAYLRNTMHRIAGEIALGFEPVAPLL